MPFITVVTTPPFAESEDELIRDVVVLTPFTVEVSVLTAEERSFVLMNRPVVVAVTPFTTEVSVKEFVVVDMVRVFDVEDATRLARLVDVATPLTVVVSTVPEVESAFDEMTDEVAVTPFMIVVRIFPVTDCVNELMIFASEEEMPLIATWNTLADEEAVADVIILVVPVDPPIFEVMVFPLEEMVFEVKRLVVVSPVVLAFPNVV